MSTRTPRNRTRRGRASDAYPRSRFLRPGFISGVPSRPSDIAHVGLFDVRFRIQGVNIHVKDDKGTLIEVGNYSEKFEQSAHVMTTKVYRAELRKEPYKGELAQRMMQAALHFLREYLNS